jgi:streptogramin lyase
MIFTQRLSASASSGLLTAARALTVSFVSKCCIAAARLVPLATMLLASGAVCTFSASAQTAHLSQTQIVLNLPSALDWPQSVAVDANENIYVADAYNHRVVKLTPSNGGLIQSTVGTGFSQPYGVAVDASGNVYITDIFATTLFKETPNGSGGYTQSTIGSGLYDAVSVAVDKQGNVYGTETNNSFVGSIFKETLSGGVYTQSFLPAPTSHIYGIAVDGNGDLFLNDGWENEIFEDTPLAGGGYTTMQIYSGGGAMAVDSQNNLYIAGYPGSIVKLTPNGSGGFTSSYIPTDDNAIPTPYGYFDAAGLAVDANGDLFFDDLYTFNLIEESMSGANFGQVPVGTTAYPVSMYFTFDTAGTLGSYSIDTDGVPNTEFTDSYLGTCYSNQTYPVGYACNVDVSLTPAAPGTRAGAVVLSDGSGTPFATGYVQGTGVSPLVGFDGGSPAPLITGMDAPLGVTVDASGNIIVANSGTKDVLLNAPGGGQSQVGSGFVNPTGVAEDGAGNIFVADSGSVYEIAKVTGAQTNLNISGLTNPNDLAIDGAGNLYISEPNLGKVMKVTPAGIQTSVGTGLNAPRGLAVDAGGNVYIADYAAGNVYVVAPSGTQSTISGLGGPSGVAVDAAGNVYVAVYGSGELVEVAPGGARTTLASGLASPYAVALDGSGNLYFSEYGSGTVKKIDRVDAPALNFASTAVGTTSADSPKMVTLANDGNAALSFPIPISGNDPSIGTNFNLVSGDPSECPVVSAGSSQPGTLAVGASCVLPVSFTPVSAGNISGALTLTDNSLNAVAPNYATQSVQLQGTATQSLAVLTNPTPNVGTVLGTNATFNWTTGTGVSSYDLYLGTTGPGSSNVYTSGHVTTTSVTVASLPSNGITVYARLYSYINGGWQYLDYTYLESGTPVPAALTSPTPGVSTVLATSNVTFQWNAGTGVSLYQLNLSAIAPGGSELLLYKGAATSANVPSLPSNAVTVYARLYSRINGAWQYNDYVYTESGIPTPAALTSPTPGSSTLLGTSSVEFQWSTGTAVTLYQLNLGTTAPGSSDLFFYKGAATSANVSSLPDNAVTVYARLYSKIHGSWQYNDYVYTESGTPTPAMLTSPTPGLSTLLGTSNVAFQWSAGTGVSLYQLNLSAVSPGASDLFLYKGGATSANVPSLPANGVKVYARLYSKINGVWQFNDYVYTEQ